MINFVFTCRVMPFQSHQAMHSQELVPPWGKSRRLQVARSTLKGFPSPHSLVHLSNFLLQCILVLCIGSYKNL